ncbi:hypothetical protein [Streptomyces sp. NPDC086182]|uniref:hypothetical protein n=1 Tax=Streptomyces sp. NPDC086182 TaxID=3155058 RepID=UPI003449E80D
MALRISAIAGTVMTGLMRVAERPLARHLSDGSPSMSVDPLPATTSATPPPS